MFELEFQSLSRWINAKLIFPPLCCCRGFCKNFQFTYENFIPDSLHTGWVVVFFLFQPSLDIIVIIRWLEMWGLSRLAGCVSPLWAATSSEMGELNFAERDAIHKREFNANLSVFIQIVVVVVFPSFPSSCVHLHFPSSSEFDWVNQLSNWLRKAERWKRKRKTRLRF